MDDDIAAIWAEARPRVMGRVDVLRSAADAALAGDLDEARLAEAVGEAHKLAGSLGMFGFSEGSRVAARIEQALDGTAPLAPDGLVEQVRALVASLDGAA